MSAGTTIIAAAAPRIITSLEGCAPLFAQSVEAALADCQRDGIDAMIAETLREHDTAVLYYARGRTVKPPTSPVTNAVDETYTWHGYGLACDIISRRFAWFDNAAAKIEWPDRTQRMRAADAWFAAMAARFRAHDCKSGLDWKRADPPHIQWGRCKPSPSDRARELLRTLGVRAVWQAVGAMQRAA